MSGLTRAQRKTINQRKTKAPVQKGAVKKKQNIYEVVTREEKYDELDKKLDTMKKDIISKSMVQKEVLNMTPEEVERAEMQILANEMKNRLRMDMEILC